MNFFKQAHHLQSSLGASERTDTFSQIFDDNRFIIFRGIPSPAGWDFLVVEQARKDRRSTWFSESSAIGLVDPEEEG